jgi:acyl-ACP thioesterase
VLWVHLDPLTLHPSRLTEAEIAAYGTGSAVERRITARLRHPAPPETSDTSIWRFRATECDLAGHVNNAAYWQPLEEELLSGSDPTSLDVEIEYRNPAQPGDKHVVREGNRRWILNGDGQPNASIVIAEGPLPS